MNSINTVLGTNMAVWTGQLNPGLSLNATLDCKLDRFKKTEKKDNRHHPSETEIAVRFRTSNIHIITPFPVVWDDSVLFLAFSVRISTLQLEPRHSCGFQFEK